MRAYMWDQMKDWLLQGAIETDEKMAADLAGPGYGINRRNLLVLESKAEMQKRGQASPDDGDALALTFAAAVEPVAPKEYDDEDEFHDLSGYGSGQGAGCVEVFSGNAVYRPQTPDSRPRCGIPRR